MKELMVWCISSGQWPQLYPTISWSLGLWCENTRHWCDQIMITLRNEIVIIIMLIAILIIIITMKTTNSMEPTMMSGRWWQQRYPNYTEYQLALLKQYTYNISGKYRQTIQVDICVHNAIKSQYNITTCRVGCDRHTGCCWNNHGWSAPFTLVKPMIYCHPRTWHGINRDMRGERRRILFIVW